MVFGVVHSFENLNTQERLQQENPSQALLQMRQPLGFGKNLLKRGES